MQAIHEKISELRDKIDSLEMLDDEIQETIAAEAALIADAMREKVERAIDEIVSGISPDIAELFEYNMELEEEIREELEDQIRYH